MTPEHRQYVTDNMNLFTQSRKYAPEELAKMFEILADVTNTPQKVTRCGRCIENTKKQILFHYGRI
tara:strand:- start:70 stop:267 length:198 start_codon:yes stop_codon:yes gene_type:complete